MPSIVGRGDDDDDDDDAAVPEDDVVVASSEQQQEEEAPPAAPTLFSLPADVWPELLSFLDVFSLMDFAVACPILELACQRAISSKKDPDSNGNIIFRSNEELKDAVAQYCESLETPRNVELAEWVARQYGWVMNDWNVSQVSDFSCLFRGQTNFNEFIGDWDMSNATDLSEMFRDATTFHQDLSRWNLSNVESMKMMFLNAESFHQDLGTWDTSKVIIMDGLFHRARRHSMGTFRTGIRPRSFTWHTCLRERVNSIRIFLVGMCELSKPWDLCFGGHLGSINLSIRGTHPV